MTNQELKEYMKERLDKQDDLIKGLSSKLDPIIEEHASMKGAIIAIRWLVGVGFGAIVIIIALLELKYK